MLRNAKTIPPGYRIRRAMGVWFFQVGKKWSVSYESHDAARVAAWNDLFSKVNAKVKSHV